MSVEIADAALAGGVARGDLAAFEVLVRRYSGRVFGLAFRILNDRAEAEDVTQEVFATAWRRLDSLSDPAAVRTWLFRVAHRQCLGVLRRNRTDPVGDLPDTGATPVGLGQPPRDPSIVAETVAAVAALRLALRRLPEPQRAAWLLAEVDGLSYAQIALAVGASEESVRGRLARARVRLAEVMKVWR
ncbi:RNA polymerase sigma factor [Saccharothrix algeriensis]|uniref:RNA polymerase sigma factor n=1 Tax=Saccharothrix algeriensis TaxID=173560 RepID=A0A8T8I4W1_9PSEU|nr:RNA polymerase sigma factor [Saccharothrix algeriensis]MBM7811975.1 RNA polymerase sigma-70 factor (ECF subfamily) [Saccharothrix algeriensis]QTR05671.1 RNA polymerase sigma factor [Saccharothrix algeriensis]